MCEARDNSGVIPCEVVQLDSLCNTVVLFRVFSSADEDLLVVILDVVEFEEGCALLDDTSLYYIHQQIKIND